MISRLRTLSFLTLKASSLCRHGRRCYSALPASNKTFLANPLATPEVTINGWIKSVRKSKNIAFADVSDGTTGTPVAIVMNPEDAKSLLTGACVEITGKVQPSQGHQDYEVFASKVNIVGPATKDYPLQKKYHSQEFLRSIPEYRWKTNTGASTLRYRSSAISKITSYFEQLDFTQVNSPIITASDCEGGGEVFQISGGKEGPEFFGPAKPAYLSVSSQLHLEVFTAALSRVWNLAPAFRAEPSDTNRHLSEFWMIEAEMAFATELEQIMTVAENMIRSAVKPLLEHSGDNNTSTNPLARDILATKRDDESKALVKERWAMLAASPDPWTRITYTKAIEILTNLYTENNAVFQGESAPQWGDGLASVHEKYLAGTHFGGPVFITDYPVQQKPFYMLANADGTTVSCFDLVVPHIGELIGGSMRESNYEKLVLHMAEREMDAEHLKWYLRLREHGSFPHGGYGMGFERFIAFVCGQDNIRDVIGFPRWAGNCIC